MKTSSFWAFGLVVFQLLGPLLAQSSTNDPTVPQIGNLVLVSERRVDRVRFEYVLRVEVINRSEERWRGVELTIESDSPNTVISEGVLTVGDLHPGTSRTPTDTIAIVQDRRVPFSLEALTLAMEEHVVPRQSIVAGGQFFTVGIQQNGSLWSWGSNGREGGNGSGKLGLGPTDSFKIATPQAILPAQQWRSVSIGWEHTVALNADGSVWAWGWNPSGGLGDGTRVDRGAPVQIDADNDWVAVAAGSWHSLGLRRDGSLWAWGDGNRGLLGNGSEIDSLTPIRIGTDSDWIEISTGTIHSLARKRDGSLWVWGENNHGQFGDGTTDHSSVPIRVGTDNDWVAIEAGTEHSVALKRDGTLWSWGRNQVGQLGRDGSGLLPGQVGTGSDWREIRIGDYHNLAVKSDGSLWGWGLNVYGQLGEGKRTVGRQEVLQIGEATDWIEFDAGATHSLGIRVDGSIWTWGETHTESNIVPKQVGQSTNWGRKRVPAPGSLLVGAGKKIGVTSITREDGDLVLKVNTKFGRHYTLQSSTDLLSWTLAGEKVIGTGALRTIRTDIGTSAPRQLFYRLIEDE